MNVCNEKKNPYFTSTQSDHYYCPLVRKIYNSCSPHFELIYETVINVLNSKYSQYFIINFSIKDLIKSKIKKRRIYVFSTFFSMHMLYIIQTF